MIPVVASLCTSCVTHTAFPGTAAILERLSPASQAKQWASAMLFDSPHDTFSLFLLQLRGAEPNNIPSPGKVGESIASNVNGPDPKKAVSEVCPF